MPAAPRPNRKAMKIAYNLLNTPKEMRQDTQPKPTEKQLREWWKDSSAAQ